jgi:hypothetical protein
VDCPQRLENLNILKILSSSCKVPEHKPLGHSTKSSTPEAQKSTNLKSELWFFHSGFTILAAVSQQFCCWCWFLVSFFIIFIYYIIILTAFISRNQSITMAVSLSKELRLVLYVIGLMKSKAFVVLCCCLSRWRVC